MSTKDERELPLTRRQRTTCLMAWVDGKSCAAIAAEEGVATRTVETRLFRARRRMRAAGIEPPRRKVVVRVRALQLGMIANV